MLPDAAVLGVQAEASVTKVFVLLRAQVVWMKLGPAPVVVPGVHEATPTGGVVTGAGQVVTRKLGEGAVLGVQLATGTLVLKSVRVQVV